MAIRKQSIFSPEETLIIRGNLEVRGNTIVYSDNELRIADDKIIINNEFSAASATLILRSGANDYGATITYAGGNLLLSNAMQGSLYTPPAGTFLVDSPAVFNNTVLANGLITGDITNANIANNLAQPIQITFSGDLSGSGNLQYGGETVDIFATVTADAVRLGEDTTGNYVANLYVDSGIVYTGTTGEGASGTLTHYTPDNVAADFSEINSDADVIQTLEFSFDEFGHATLSNVASANLDLRYYTQNYIDANFVPQTRVIGNGAGLIYALGTTGVLTNDVVLAVGDGRGIRVNQSNVELDFSEFTTNDVVEGNVNLYFTPDRVRTNISLSATMEGGTFDYDSANGIFTYVERSNAQITGLISAEPTSNITYDANTGIIGQQLTTDDVTEGNNLYYTDSRARNAISLVANMEDGSFNYSTITGQFTYTERTRAQVRALFSAGYGLTYNAAAGIFTIDTGNVVTISDNQTITGDKTFTGNVDLANANIVDPRLVRTDTDATLANTYTFTGNVDLRNANTFVNSGKLPEVNTTTWVYTVGSNDSTIANTYYVEKAVSNRIDSLIEGAPNFLDTLDEIAASLNDDPNLAANVFAALANKVSTSFIVRAGEGLNIDGNASSTFKNKTEFTLDVDNTVVRSNLQVSTSDGILVNGNTSALLNGNIALSLTDTFVRTSGDQSIAGEKTFTDDAIFKNVVLDTSNYLGQAKILNSSAKPAYPSIEFYDESYTGGLANSDFIYVNTNQFEISHKLVSNTISIRNQYTLPLFDGNANSVITTDGNGTLTFKDDVVGVRENANIFGDRNFFGNISFNNSTEANGELFINNVTQITSLVETNSAVIWYEDTIGSNVNVYFTANSVLFRGDADVYANGVGRAHEVDFGNTTVYIGSSDRKSLYTDNTGRLLEYLSVDGGVVFGPSRSNTLIDGSIYYDGIELLGVVGGNVYSLIEFALEGQIFPEVANADAQIIKPIQASNYVSYGIVGGTNINVSEDNVANVIIIDGLSNTAIQGVARLGITAAGNITFNQTTGVISQQLKTTDIPEGTRLYYTDERVDDRIANLFFATGNLSFTYDDVNNTYTLSESLTTDDIDEGTNLYYTDERVDDRISNLFVAGTSIDLTYDDSNNTFTIATSNVDAQLLDGLDSTQFLRSDIDATKTGNLTITGDLLVTGNAVIMRTEQLLVEDSVIVINSEQTSPNTDLNDIGVLFQRYANATTQDYNVILHWDEQNDVFTLGKTTATGTENDLTVSESWITVTDQGNVGIGNTAPVHEISIGGNAYISDTLTVDNNVAITNDLTVDGNVVLAALQLLQVLGVSQGGTGANTLLANSVLIGNGVEPIQQVTGQTGDVLFINSQGAPQFGGIDGGFY